MTTVGYFSVDRALLTHPLWTDEPFSRGQAWVDLIGLASHKDGWLRVSGQRISLTRGQCGWSELNLAGRWRWSRGKIRRFLSELESDKRISIKKNTRNTIITICNYDSYQGSITLNGTTENEAKSASNPRSPSKHHSASEMIEKTVQQTDTKTDTKTIDESPVESIIYNAYGVESGTTDGTTDGTSDGHQTDIRRYTNNNDKNEKKKKEECAEVNYAFNGDVIRLNEKDFIAWQKTYHAIPDLRAKLLDLDAWHREHLTPHDKWFVRVSRSLSKEHQEWLFKSQKPRDKNPAGVGF